MRQRKYSSEEVLEGVDTIFARQFSDETDGVPWGSIWPGLLAEELDVSRQTASKYLSELEDDGRLKTMELAHTTVYAPIDLKAYRNDGTLRPQFPEMWPRVERIKLSILNRLIRFGLVEYEKNNPSTANPIWIDREAINAGETTRIGGATQ